MALTRSGQGGSAKPLAKAGASVASEPKPRQKPGDRARGSRSKRPTEAPAASKQSATAAARPRRSVRQRPGLRIGQVARAAGVAPSVISFYSAEGLLPPPVKTSRNSAWYSPETVEWVKLIRELQQAAFLPLRVVKKIVGAGSSVERIRETFLARPIAPALKSLGPVNEAELLRSTGFDAAILGRLEALGVLTPRQASGQRSYSSEDATIVRQLGRMRDAGLTADRGFGPDQMRIYQVAVERLAREEVRFAVEGLVGRVAPESLQEAAATWMDAADEILRTMHRKALKHQLRDLGSRMKK